VDVDPVILAVASPPGHAYRGIVRLSGRAVRDLLRPHFSIRDAGAVLPESGLHHARLHGLHAIGGEIPCLLLLFKGPRSYTGQDAAEIQLPGNPALLDRIIDAMLDSAARRDIDARRAEPGEFTARAFLLGKLSLTEAEGVAATISARSDAELRAAHVLSSGRLGALARELADDLAGGLALVEAGIDFTDQEDVVPIAPADLRRRLVDLRERIDRETAHAVGTEQLRSIPWVVLTGPPNAGKSTLFNALLGHDRAVVSPVAGTTRDVITEPLTIETDHGPAEVMLVDLAGAVDAGTPLEQRMQAAAADALHRAELVLECVPPGAAPAATAEDGIPTATWAAGPPAAAETLRLATMIDLAPSPRDERAGLAVSADTGAGLDALRREIADRLAERAVSLAADTIVLRPRHEAALRLAADNLAEAIDQLAPMRDARAIPVPELLAAPLRAALDALGELAGDVSADDVLARVFSTFCVGK